MTTAFARLITNCQNQTASIAGDSGAVDWLADAEIKIDLAVLRYARDAGGGRINPARLTKNLSRAPLTDPSEVLNSIALQPDPAAYLRGFQPSHPQFELLRQKLLELRAQASTSQPSIVIPDGPVLKKGVEHDQVALLRKRLDMRSDGMSENFFDDSLDEAVRKLQTTHGVTADGVVGTSTRRILNQEVSAEERNLPNNDGSFSTWSAGVGYHTISARST